MVPLDRPVLVTGTPRSGKTVIAKILRHDPAFCHIIEPLTIWNTGMGGQPDDVRSADDATPKTAKLIYEQCSEIVQREGKQRYLDDLAYHALRIGFAHRVLPDARIIHVVRSAEDAIPELLFGWTFRDSIKSAYHRRKKNLRLQALPRLAWRFARNYLLSRTRGRRATWGPRVPGLDAFAAEHTVAEVAAYQWCKMVEIGMTEIAKLPPTRGLQVFFDDVLHQPGQTARKIAEFCGLADPDAIVDFAESFIDPDHEFDRKVAPTESEQEKIDAMIKPIQAKIDALRGGAD